MSKPLIPGGCILIARKIIESEIWEKPPLYIKVWLFLLLKAQHSDYKKLKRGQLITSIPEIIEGVAWKVGARVEKPTKDQVFQVIDWLRKASSKATTFSVESNARATTKATMITTTKATHKILVSISNYADYQDFKSYESNDDSNDQSNDEKVTADPDDGKLPDNINKNVFNKNYKNVKKEKTISPENAVDLKIHDFRQRYSSDQLQQLDDYFDMIRHTRKSGKLAPTVKLKIYEYFDKHPAICVQYATHVHTETVAYHSKDEKYTFGIVRRTTADDAERKLEPLIIKQPNIEAPKGAASSVIAPLELPDDLRGALSIVE